MRAVDDIHHQRTVVGRERLGEVAAESLAAVGVDCTTPTLEYTVCSEGSSQDAQKPSIRATSNEALCILLRFWTFLEAICIAHLVDDFLPRPFKCVAIVGLDAV